MVVDEPVDDENGFFDIYNNKIPCNGTLFEDDIKLQKRRNA